MPVVDAKQFQQRQAAEAVIVSPEDAILPVEDFILVRRTQITSETAGGIALPDRLETKYEGEVVATGPGKGMSPMFIIAGQRVLFLPHAGIPIQQGDSRLLLVRQDAVFATVQSPQIAVQTARTRAKRTRR